MNATFTRRTFLGASVAALAVGAASPSIDVDFARTATLKALSDRVLVVLELAGGNDGLSTVVPLGNDDYFRARPKLALKQDLLNLNGTVALHSNLTALKELYDSGNLAVVQGVGYPNIKRTHHQAKSVWRTADPANRRVGSWLARAGQALCGQNHLPTKPALVPSRFQKMDVERRSVRSLIAIEDQCHVILHNSPANASASFRRQLFAIVRLIPRQTGFAYFHVKLDGFDTHTLQQSKHDQLMHVLSSGLGDFLKALKSRGIFERVVVMVVSEFGRRVHENSSRGTDHGTSAPMFILGPKVVGGIYGEHPSLRMPNLHKGDMMYGIVFRRVYATLLENWFGLNSTDILYGAFDPIPFIRKL